MSFTHEQLSAWWDRAFGANCNSAFGIDKADLLASLKPQAAEGEAVEEGQLHPEFAKRAAKTALDWLRHERFQGVFGVLNDAPWPHREDLALAIDMLEELAGMTLKLADRTHPTEKPGAEFVMVPLEKWLKWLPAGITQAVCEIPDRDSPEGMPDMCLVKPKELIGIVQRQIEILRADIAVSPTAAPPASEKSNIVKVERGWDHKSNPERPIHFPWVKVFFPAGDWGSRDAFAASLPASPTKSDGGAE